VRVFLGVGFNTVFVRFVCLFVCSFVLSFVCSEVL
jgi:hypothetical protein